MPVIRKVVIDGPALVYSVCARLSPRSGSSVAGVDAQPSYTEINRGVAELLAALNTREVDMLGSHPLRPPPPSLADGGTEKQSISMGRCPWESEPFDLSAWKGLVRSSRVIANSVRGHSNPPCQQNQTAPCRVLGHRYGRETCLFTGAGKRSRSRHLWWPPFSTSYEMILQFAIRCWLCQVRQIRTAQPQPKQPVRLSSQTTRI